jgi:NAD(P)-dependent dehydrogenase (short-subunit alcohol dehydrogenase family)
MADDLVNGWRYHRDSSGAVSAVDPNGQQRSFPNWDAFWRAANGKAATRGGPVIGMGHCRHRPCRDRVGLHRAASVATIAAPRTSCRPWRGYVTLSYGRIVNVSSIAGIGTALPGKAFYAATKAEVAIWT